MTDDIARLEERCKLMEAQIHKLPALLQVLTIRNEQQERELARQQDEIERLKDKLCFDQP